MSEAAKICGVTRQRIHRLFLKGQFIKPIATIGKMHLWDEKEVREWNAKRHVDREERRKELAQRGLSPTSRGLLSPRETEILALAAQGLKGAERAKKLGISFGTMAHIKTNAFRKLSVNKIEDAIIRAIDLGIIKEENNDDN